MSSRILSLNRIRVLRNSGIARRAVNTNSGTDKFDKVDTYRYKLTYGYLFTHNYTF